MKSAWKSKTMWFNWFITTIVTVSATAMLYLPEFGMTPETTAKFMFGLTLLTTFGNKIIRKYGTKGPIK